METPSFNEDHISQIPELQILKVVETRILLIKYITVKLNKQKKGVEQVLLT